MDLITDKYELYNADCHEILGKMEANSVDMCLTDPPYFFLGMNEDWDADKINASVKEWRAENQDREARHGNRFLEMSLGYEKGGGSTYGREKTIEFYHFMKKVSDAVYKVLKPGSFYFAFSQPRLVHRMMTAIEDSGFNIRDLMIWYHPNGSPSRAMSLERHVDSRYGDEQSQSDLVKSMENRKTPVPAVLYEPIVFAQKPPEGSLIDNWKKYGVGLMDMNTKSGGILPSNVLYFNKPLGVKNKHSWNNHPTVKPLDLIEYLIYTYSKKGDIILDPFLGSGTTVVASINQHRKGVGIEKAEAYFDICKKRVAEAVTETRLF